jgi:hypothetical protein
MQELGAVFSGDFDLRPPPQLERRRAGAPRGVFLLRVAAVVRARFR